MLGATADPGPRGAAAGEPGEPGEPGGGAGDSDRDARRSFLAPLQVEADGAVDGGAADEEDWFGREIELFAPPRHVSGVATSLLVVSASVGVAVLSLSDSFAQLGWFLGLSFMLLFGLVNVWSGLMYHEAATFYPRAIGPVEMAHLAVGNPHFTNFVSVILQTYFFLLIALQFLVLVDVLRAAFFGVADLCRPIWGAIACVLLLPLLQFRSFHAMRHVLWLNLVLFYLAAVVAIGVFIREIVVNGSAETVLLEQSLSFRSFFSATSKIIFSFMGTDLYLQFMSEMKEVSTFPRHLWASNLLIGLTYVAFASVGYLWVGPGSIFFILEAMPRDWTYNFVNFVMFLHVLVSYALNSHVLHCWLHKKLLPHTVNNYNCAGTMHWLLISSMTLSIAFVVANAVPLFNQLASLIGSLQSPFLAYIFPLIAVIASRRRHKVHISRLEWVGFTSLFVFSIILFFCGTAANVMDIYSQYVDMHPSFSECGPA